MTDLELTKLQQISDVAWLVNRGGERIGILNQDIQNNFIYISGANTLNFHDRQEVKEYFGNIKLFEEQIDKPVVNPDKYYVKGHEVDYAEPFAVQEGEEGYDPALPLYTKLEGSDVYYAAGYYCIHFGKGWKHARAPKAATLYRYGFEGPFQTELEAKQRMKYLNRNATAK
jgi:hypothetical protein